MIFNITGGGAGSGDAALNFNVVAYATEEELLATAPMENTTGIVTTTPITRWIFSATEPNPTEGMVWIITYTYSPGDFNALKKNGIQVYPVGAKQYISGSWVNCPAKICQNGGWVDLFLYLYNTGDENIDLTGGWIAKAGDWAPGSDDAQRAPVIERKIDSMRVYQNGTGGGYATPTIKIDLTGYTKLKADVTVNGTGSPDWTRFSILKPGALMSDEMATVMMNLGRRVYSLDISSITGTQIVAFVLYKLSSTQADITVHKVWLER